MAIFIIEIPEVHYSRRKIEADTIEDAFETAANGEEIGLEYSDTIDPDGRSWRGGPADNPHERFLYDGDNIKKA